MSTACRYPTRGAHRPDCCRSRGGRLDLGGVNPFAPCRFDEIEDYPEVEEADELILITTGGSCDTEGLTEAWNITLLEP